MTGIVESIDGKVGYASFLLFQDMPLLYFIILEWNVT
jgi:hypothetical protein